MSTNATIAQLITDETALYAQSLVMMAIRDLTRGLA